MPSEGSRHIHTGYHGVFAPNSSHRAWVTKAGRGRGARRPEDRTPAERRTLMTWAQRLKRVFGIDIQTCPACGGAMRIIACIEDPVVIEKILALPAAQCRSPAAIRGERAHSSRSSPSQARATCARAADYSSFFHAPSCAYARA